MQRIIANNYFTKTKRIIAYILLFIQLSLPVFVASSSIVKAAQNSQSNHPMMDTINGLNNLIKRPMTNEVSSVDKEPVVLDENSTVVKSSTPSISGDLALSMLELHFSSQPIATSIQPPKNIQQDDIFNTLPTLSSNDSEQNSPTVVSTEQQIAQNISQLAQTLSTDDAIKAYMSYARSIGENLVNQKIHDWLSQLGNARVQINSNKTADVDLLVPLVDKPNSLLFSQIGIRANDHRNTTNLGVGYRQYQDAWMWGINSFYDYDITNSNSRFSVGGELWADYIKLAVNSYFRLTDWHQSSMHDLRDYDERPANGFDLRAEGFLPSYPHLGAYAKYEKYFGDGISLNHGLSSGDLVDNPSATTLGLSYTPFPLLTFKTQISRGDTKESNIGMELAYRFGVLLAEQLDPDNVDLMRSLVGNRYDFVDRNYNIVMQYRKQELLSISLPENTNGEAAQTLPVTVTVNKAKYGLKKVNWSAPELIAQGGNIQVMSPTTINLTLPAYIFQPREKASQSYRISAVAVDNEGNQSNTAVMTINVKPSQDTIRAISLTPNNTLVANNSDTYVATALVQNKKHQPLAGKAITFTIAGFKSSGVTLFDMNGNSGDHVTVSTDSEGKAGVRINSKVVGTGTLTAEMKNGNRNAIPVSFLPDIATAKVHNVTLIGAETNKVADGISRFTFEALVTDQFDNPVPKVNVNWSHDKGNTAILSAQQSQTDENGRATITLTSQVVVDNVTVSANYHTAANKVAANKAVNFIYILATAKVDSVTLKDSELIKVADNNSFFTFTAQLVDGNGNPIKQKGLEVNWSHNKGDEVRLARKSQTDEEGRASIKLQSTMEAIEGVIVSARFGSTKRVDAKSEVTFIADENTIKVKSVTLNGGIHSKLANGYNRFIFTALVVDYNNSPVEQRTVKWAHNKNDEVSLSATTSQTDENGLAVITLYSTTTAVDNIIVSAQYGSSTAVPAQEVNFYADIKTAKVKSVTLVDPVASKVADGNNTFTFKVRLVDRYDNPINKAGLLVEWSHNKEGQVKLSAQTSLTDESGIATIILQSSKSAVDKVKVYAKYKVPPKIAANEEVSFTGDVTTARVGNINLNDAGTSKIADGKSSFEFSAQLVDSQGNAVKQAGLEIKWRQDKGTKVSLPTTSKTDADGRATVILQSTRTAVEKIGIFAQYDTSDEKQAEEVSFIADINTAQIKEVTLVDTDIGIDKVANGSNFFTFNAQLADKYGNPIKIADLDITWLLDDKVKDVQLSAASSKTDSSGRATIQLKSTTKAVDYVVVSAQFGPTAKVDAKTAVNFIADVTTAKVGNVTLDGDILRKVADGKNHFIFKAQLVDRYHNLIRKPNLVVNWQQDKGNLVTLSSASSKTDTNGQATIELQNTKIAVSDIVVSALYGSGKKKDADEKVNFIQVSFDVIQVNGHQFNLNDGFPSIGFRNATFTIETNGDDADKFDWQSDQPSWVRVKNGKVDFIGDASSQSKTVTITAQHKTGGSPLTYKIKLDKWATYYEDVIRLDTARGFCLEKNKRLPVVKELSMQQNLRGMNSIWGEWGSRNYYQVPNFRGKIYYWVENGSNLTNSVGMQSGKWDRNIHPQLVMCFQDL
ncbi:MAG: inverse autotransporter beta domain-containing protein [Arsenophonus endosymbiont of Dermacentor nuttalli]